MNCTHRAVERLKLFEYVPLKYHSDGRGHVQVQEVIHHQSAKLDELLSAVDRESDWDYCFKMFETQPQRWLYDLSNLLLSRKAYHTACQLKIVEIITRTESAEIIYQRADNWFWDHSNWTHLAPLIEEVTRQLNDIEPDESARDAFIEKCVRERRVGDGVSEKYQDISLFSQIKKRLEAKSKELALLYGT